MKKQTILILILVAAMSSCTHYYYMPNVQNVPLFREKNEVRATIASGGGAETSTTEIQVAHAVTNNFAVMTNFMAAKGGDKADRSWARGSYIDAGVGYYKTISEFGVFEIYGGLGSSNQHHEYGSSSSVNGTADLHFNKLFLQPSFGFTFRAFDIALSARLSRVTFGRIDNNITNDIEFDYVDSISRNRNSLLFEPALTIRGGWKHVKIQLQFVTSKNLSHPNLRFETQTLSIGLFFTLNRKNWNTIKKNEN